MVAAIAIRLGAAATARYHRAVARALLLAMCSLLARPTLAAAEARTSKVTIETDPPGAKVYFGLKEDGEICTTPCTVDAPVGETAIIVEAENRRSIIESLVVRKRARPQKLIYKLELAVGTLVVEGGAGATIKLDDLDRGKAPLRIDNIQAGGHHVALERNGKAIYDEFIEIEAGGEATVSAPAAVETPPVGDAAALAATAHPSAAGRRGARSLAVSAAVDVGYRHFNYSIPDAAMRTPYEQDEQELGQVL